MTARPSTLAFYGICAICAVKLAVASWLVLVVAPVEEVMGPVQKIFYLHVPSAMGMYLCVLLCSISSLVFLLRRSEAWDAAGKAGAEVGTLFCIIVLITGPIWANHAWGTAWVWDPRLTGVAVLGLILGSYHLARAVGQESVASRRLAAALGVLAAPNGLLIHYAVSMWGGQHPTVIYQGGGLDPTMEAVFYFCISTVGALSTVLYWWRLDLALLRHRVEATRVEALLAAGNSP